MQLSNGACTSTINPALSNNQSILGVVTVDLAIECVWCGSQRSRCKVVTMVIHAGMD